MTPARRRQARERLEATRAAKARHLEELRARARAEAQRVPMTPLAAISAVADALPPEAVVVDESISSSGGLRTLVRSDDPRSFFGLRGGGIGWGLPAAIGVKLALPGPAGGGADRRRERHVHVPGALDGGALPPRRHVRDPEQRLLPHPQAADPRHEGASPPRPTATSPWTSTTRASTSCAWPSRSGCARSGSRRRPTSGRRSGRAIAAPGPDAPRRRARPELQARVRRRGRLGTMRIAYFDCPSGASGDMVLGALVDAGCAARRRSRPRWRASASRAGGSRPRPVERGGLRGTHLVVRTDPARRFHALGDMLRPIERSTLPDAVKARAAAVLRRLAEAEARVHRVPVEAVHFHEVGDLDTLVDVVGSVAGLDALGVERVHVSPLPIGGGTVETAHGRLPVPAPATAELLRGFPVYDNGDRGGAGHADGGGDPDDARDARPPAGHDARADRLGRGDPGARRCRTSCGVLVGEATAGGGGARRGRDAGERRDDDRRHVAPALRAARSSGSWRRARSTCTSRPVVMKRSRPGTVLTALAPPELADRLAEVLFRETTDDRGALERGAAPAAAAGDGAPRRPTFGPVTFKVSTLGGRVVTVTPEFEEVRRIADARGAAGPRGAGGGAPGGAPGDRGRRGRPRGARGLNGPPAGGRTGGSDG